MFAGLSACSFCEVGKFENAVRATDCISCGEFLTTAAPASTHAEDCLCGQGQFTRSYHLPATNDSNEETICEPCMKGLDCSTDWPNSWNAKGEGAPLTEAGYYATISDPYSVYLCHDLLDCSTDW